jgi:hypothetical protein
MKGSELDPETNSPLRAARGHQNTGGSMPTVITVNLFGGESIEREITPDGFVYEPIEDTYTALEDYLVQLESDVHDAHSDVVSFEVR